MKDNFYNRLKEYKTINKVSNAALGEVIGKNEPAMRQAIKRQSLSKFEINELEKLFYTIETVSEDLKNEADSVALNFEQAKKASKLFELTIQNANKDYFIKKLAEFDIIVK